RHTRFSREWSSDVCSSDLKVNARIKNFDEFVGSNEPNRLAFENQVFEENPNATPKEKMQLAQSVENILLRIELEMGGDPMRPPRSEERRVGKDNRSSMSQH